MAAGAPLSPLAYAVSRRERRSAIGDGPLLRELPPVDHRPSRPVAARSGVGAAALAKLAHHRLAVPVGVLLDATAAVSRPAPTRERLLLRQGLVSSAVPRTCVLDPAVPVRRRRLVRAAIRPVARTR